MLKKLVAIVLSICCLASTSMLLSACGGGAQGQTNTYEDVIDWDKIDWEGKNDSSNTILVYFSNDMQDYYAPKIEAFEDAYPQYDVEVRWGAAGDGVKQEQTSAISTGNPPDLILGGDVHIENQKGFLLPLNKLIERDAQQVQSEDFLDGMLDSLSSGEGLYYLPTTFNVSVLLYNKDLFDQAGQAYPTEDWTFEDFVAAGKALTKYDSSGAAQQWGNQTVTEWWTQWYSMLRMDGGSLYDDEGYVTLNTEEGIRALTNWRRITGVQGQTNAQYPDKIGTHNGSDGGNLGNFAGGKVAMLYSVACGQLMTFSNSNLNFDVAPLPKSALTDSRAGIEMSITAYGIHKNSKNKQGAWELLKWLTAPRTDLQELAEFAMPTPRKSERDMQLAVPKEERATKYKNLEAIYDSVSIAASLPRLSYFEEVTMQYIVPEVNKLIDGTYSTAEQAAKAAEENANAYIMYRYKTEF